MILKGYVCTPVLVSLICGACALDHANLPKGKESNMGGGLKTAPVIYVALGDSTGVGVGARQGGGYVERLFTRIKRIRPGSHLLNLCVSGATTSDVLRGQVQRVQSAGPTLITLGIGINDVGRGTTVEQFARNYEEIVSQLKQNKNIPIVITNIPDISLAPVVPAQMRDEARRRIGLYNAQIKQIVELHGLLMVDAYSMSRDVIPSRPDFFSADGFHPSELGYERWTEAMWPTVEKAVSSGQ